jgi:hypothetical protein
MMSRATAGALLIICLAAIRQLGAVERRGVIDGAERWTAENSPYVITDDLLVSRTGRLAILPGTRIIVGKPVAYDSAITQMDHLDSFTVSIRVEGSLSCIGRPNNRIAISGAARDRSQCSWYGLVLDSVADAYTEIAFTDIADACAGIVVRACSPLIRNCALEYNNVGLLCRLGSRPDVSNCVFAYNYAAGIRIDQANPIITNSIIAFNRNNGVWSDGVSEASIEYNCVFGNRDGDFLGCDPEIGILSRVNKHGDSTDSRHNLRADPVFAGTRAESLAVEMDISLPTDRSRMKDTSLARVVYDTLADSLAFRRVIGTYRRYMLSTYSPCVNAGKPGARFRDSDDSRNDMGIWGGPEFFDRSAGW